MLNPSDHKALGEDAGRSGCGSSYGCHVNFNNIQDAILSEGVERPMEATLFPDIGKLSSFTSTAQRASYLSDSAGLFAGNWRPCLEIPRQEIENSLLIQSKATAFVGKRYKVALDGYTTVVLLSAGVALNVLRLVKYSICTSSLYHGDCIRVVNGKETLEILIKLFLKGGEYPPFRLYT